MNKKVTPELAAAIKVDRETNGSTLYDLASRYGLSKSTTFNIIRGCDASKVKRASPKRRVVQPITGVDRPLLSKTDLGEAARLLICARLMLNGVKVFRPLTEDTPTDLLVLKGDNSIARCQCKYIYPTAIGCHNMNLTSVRKSGPNTKAKTHRYTLAEVDFFLGYCLDNDSVYVIPNRDTNGVKCLAFWVLRDSVGRNGGNALDTSKCRSAYGLLK
jgi:hypothetical protein